MAGSILSESRDENKSTSQADGFRFRCSNQNLLNGSLSRLIANSRSRTYWLGLDEKLLKLVQWSGIKRNLRAISGGHPEAAPRGFSLFFLPRPPILPQLDSRSLYLVVVLRPPREAMHLGQIVFTECFGQ